MVYKEKRHNLHVFRTRGRGLPNLDLELLGWLIGGFVLGLLLKVDTAAIWILAAVAAVAAVRLYAGGRYGKVRISIWMIPVVLVGWVAGFVVNGVAF